MKKLRTFTQELKEMMTSRCCVCGKYRKDSDLVRTTFEVDLGKMFLTHCPNCNPEKQIIAAKKGEIKLD